MKNHNLPTIYSYGDYSSGNYGAHCMCMVIPPSRKNKHGITLYFSYDTLVAFRGYVKDMGGRDLFVHKNVWGTTTGKHLNFIDYGHKEARFNDKDFEHYYKEAIKNA